ncbi:MAG TPA: CocE/NonD family hydrolase, partial [Amycolatopsis sp.]|nr:CocE/NonD family hydrolase [Amycolatopsis sp.]
MGRLLSGLLAIAVTVALSPAASAESETYVIKDGVSQPIFDYQHAIRETAWVETGRDDDHDGILDRVAADIIRPSEPAARGQRIPVIMDVSPYYEKVGRGNERQPKTYAPDGTPEQFPLFYDNYFVPRGYAVVLVDIGGTNRSSGCFDEVAAGRSVVDWLNGRAKGFRSLDGTSEMKAGWANGSVGAIGKSQDGAAAIGLAVTGVPGLKTVVPIAGVASYYEVHNSDGAAFSPLFTDPYFAYNEHAKTACAKHDADNAIRLGANGDYNDAWAELNYAARVGNVRASVLVSHGFFDLNVQP